MYFALLVRGYAIDTLALADDGELELYLLQLVQALKYETVNDESKHIGPLHQGHTSKTHSNTKKGNSLASFLIERASQNIGLANFLYW